MSKKEKIISGVMLGVMGWGLLALAMYGLHSLLTRVFGDTFTWVAPAGIAGYLYMVYMQYRIFKG